jgi:hypothetical protein
MDSESKFDCYERSLDIEHRRSYSNINSHYRFQCRTKLDNRKKLVKTGDIEANWARDILSARTKFLIEKHPEIAEEFSLESNINLIDSMAVRYLIDDYRISPRIAKMAVYDALVKMLGVHALAGIERDPISYGWNQGKKKRK